MKKFYFASVLFFVFTLVSNLATQQLSNCYAAEKGLVGYWSFDEGKGEVAKDSSGKCEDANITDGEWTKGKLGNALKFNGESTHVSCATNPGLEVVGDLTIEAWVFPTNIAKGRQGIVYKHYNNEYEIIMEPTGLTHFYQGDGQWEEIEIPAESVVAENQWNHIAITRTVADSKIKYYINGEFKGEAAITKVPERSDGPVEIGWRAETDCYFQGIIDELKIYSRALSDKEISAEAKRTK